jgi:hypothetical protein
MAAPQECWLYTGTELPALLRLTPEQVDRLINTGQLRPIRICGQERFTSNEINALVETYKQIADRKIPHVQSIQ